MTRAHRIRNAAFAALLCAALAACGGGGGGGDAVQPDGGSGSTENLLSLTVLPGATPAAADVSLQLLNVDPSLSLAAVGGIAAELSFDPAWITYDGFDSRDALGGAAKLAADPSGHLLISLEGVSEGTLGVLHFGLSGTGNTGTVDWNSASFIGVAGTVLPDRMLALSGTALSN